MRCCLWDSCVTIDDSVVTTVPGTVSVPAVGVSLGSLLECWSCAREVVGRVSNNDSKKLPSGEVVLKPPDR